MSVELSESEDSDDDPENLIPRFLSLKTKLYEKAPSLFNSSKKKPPSNVALSPEALRIQIKLAKFDNDPLFDRDLAERDWQMTLSTLRMETATKPRHTNEETVANVKEDSPGVAPPAHEETPNDTPNDQRSQRNSDDDMIGGLFAESQSTPVHDENADVSHGVTIREFGKPSGLSPCRILSDACRSR